MDHPYHQLVVWKESHQFVKDIYRASERFPSDERFGVTSQLRRAAVSVSCNIVEGHAKRSIHDCLRFLDIASGSLRECAYLLELSKDLGYVDVISYAKLDDQQRRTNYLLQEFTRGTRRRLSSTSTPSKPSIPPL